MHKSIAKSVLCLFVLLAGMSGFVFAEGHLVAKVADVPITTFELQREMNTLMPMMVSFHGKISQEKYAEIQKKALDKLIERGYKVCAAIRDDISVPASEVDALIEAVRQKIQPEQFDRAVAAETMAGLRASVYRQLLAKAAEKKFIEERISVSDDDVLQFYKKHKDSYKRPRQFRASHILIKVDPALSTDEKEALRAKADDLLARARNGEDFYNLAYYNSDDRTKYVGGDLGLFHEGQTVPEFEAALRDLEVGEISDIVKTLYGFHIIKLTERNEPRQLAFEEVSEKIRNMLEDRQRKELLTQWLDSLKEQCAVETFIP